MFVVCSIILCISTVQQIISVVCLTSAVEVLRCACRSYVQQWFIMNLEEQLEMHAFIHCTIALSSFYHASLAA